jgi:prepilin-type N-terminal cleavage/methylation domain-containing protein
MNKARVARSKCRALTLTEVLVVVVVVAILIGFLLPRLVRPVRPKAKRVACTSNLKMVGAGFHMWADDHGDRFPMAVSTNNGGTREFMSGRDTFRHFLALSNDLAAPKILVCPVDAARFKVRDISMLRNSNISYFVNLDADAGQPQMVLSGDRTITGGTTTDEGITCVRTNSLAGWTSGLHSKCGNIVLADRSAQQVNGTGLRQQLQKQGREFIRLTIP